MKSKSLEKNIVYCYSTTNFYYIYLWNMPKCQSHFNDFHGFTKAPKLWLDVLSPNFCLFCHLPLNLSPSLLSMNARLFQLQPKTLFCPLLLFLAWTSTTVHKSLDNTKIWRYTRFAPSPRNKKKYAQMRCMRLRTICWKGKMGQEMCILKVGITFIIVIENKLLHIVMTHLKMM